MPEMKTLTVGDVTYEIVDEAARNGVAGIPTTVNNALAEAKANGDFKGDTGDTGPAGANGTSATHSWNGTTLTITSASGTSSADLKGDKGDTGATGPAGANGTSPTVSISTITGGHKVTITDASGTKSFDVMDGANGASASDIVPDYVVSEADRVAKEVLSKQNANTFTFFAISDMHQDLSDSQVMESNTHAGQGMDLVRQAVHVDFGAVLGDIGWGSGVSGDANRATLDLGIEEIRSANKCIDASLRGIQNFRVPGNHCSLIYNYSFNDNAYLDNDRIFPLYGAYNAGVVWQDGNKDRGYCYKDIDEHKLRVICMNTSDIKDVAPASTGDIYMSGTQMQWFAETIDLSDKTDAEEWSIVILSHCPLDFSIQIKCCEIIKAYLEGTSVSFVRDGLTISYNYSGKNAATIIGNIHGHNHNYLVDNLRYLTGEKNSEGQYATLPIDVLRIGIPNACFERTNEKGENSTVDAYDIEFGEEVSYEKVAGTAEDTAFCVITVDTAAKKIYATHYGAGYDREIDYGSVSVAATYTITNDLTNATNDNTSTTISEGGSYTANIAATDGYTLESVTVTMGGVDVTSSAYADGVITIANVTGNIVITANAVIMESEEPAVVNLLSTAEAIDSTDPYNGCGYKTGTALSTDSAKSFEISNSSAWLTGYIGWKMDCPIYVYGVSTISAAYDRILTFSTKTTAFNDAFVSGTNDAMTTYFTYEEFGGGFKLTPVESAWADKEVNYVRFGFTTGDPSSVIIAFEAQYTNLVPTAVADDGVTVYGEDYDGDGTPDGYQNNQRLNTGGAYSSATGFFATGNIKHKFDNPIYIKGNELSSVSNTRLFMTRGVPSMDTYGSVGNCVGSNASGDNSFVNWFTMETLGDMYYKLTPTQTLLDRLTVMGICSGGTCGEYYYYRLSLPGTGDTLIVTDGQPIE